MPLFINKQNLALYNEKERHLKKLLKFQPSCENSLCIFFPGKYQEIALESFLPLSLLSS
jgi:hypothetical protein